MSKLQLKRGTAARWMELNPVLAAGEPGFEYDTKRLKIGDGNTAWSNLPYVGSEEVLCTDTYAELPQVGNANCIYKVGDEKALYQWNSADLRYEELNSSGSSGSLDITLINGGSAV